MSHSKLVLGTVQFGLDYGITNATGRTSPSEVEKILSLCHSAGIHALDTSCQYGESESIIGRWLRPEHSFSVITKTKQCRSHHIGASHIELVIDAFRESLKRLGLVAVETLLVHDAEDLLKTGSSELYQRLLELKHEGLISRLGVSVYREEQIRCLLERYYLDVIQLPINVFDQRLLQAGVLDELADAGVELHARSVFLQGLLLTRPDKLPSQFQQFRRHWADYYAYLNQQRMSPVEGALSFVASLPQIEKVLVGVNTSVQLEEIIAAYPTSCEMDQFSKFALVDEQILNPSLWRN